MLTSTSRVMLAAVLLAPSPALAARYDPDAARAALRQAATLSHSTVVDASGRALEPEQAPAITAGLDEGLRLAQLASVTARSLDAAAQKRAAEMDAGVKASSELKIKELSDPIAAERLRWERLSNEHEELKQKVDALPDEEKKKLLPLLAKAANALGSAADALRPLESSIKIMSEQALEMKEAHQDSLGPLVEISSAVSGVIAHAEDLPAPLAEAKTRLGALGQEPRNVARSRAWEKLELLRGITSSLFQAADRACNRADDLRRRSASYERASGAFEKARQAASSGPAGTKALLDEARKTLAQVRERLEKPKR
jgi:hypothetical protein